MKITNRSRPYIFVGIRRGRYKPGTDNLYVTDWGNDAVILRDKFLPHLKMINLGKTHDTLSVVNDQIGTPTYTYDLARLLVDMIETEKYGYYHATNEGGYISWYDFTKEIFRQAAAMGHPEYLPENMTVNSVTTAEYGVSKAARPFNSRLDKSKLTANGFTPLPTWQDALGRYLKELDF